MMNNFKKITLLDISAVITLSIIWAALSYGANLIFNPQSSYVVLLFVLSLSACYVAFLVRKTGIVSLFYLLSVLLTFNMNTLITSGQTKLFSFLLTGLIFDLILFLMKTEENKPRDVIIAASISTALFPVIVASILSTGSFVTIISSTLNLALLSLLIGIASSLTAYLIWMQFRTTKTSLRFEFGD